MAKQVKSRRWRHGIPAAAIRNTRRIRILLASHHPLRDIYLVAANALATPWRQTRALPTW
ncbi:hypothetical protein [Sulfuritalea sp.]|uniref:hypothetical protein n=1 Tax=Sulfuritalea sp. TaxID=2480090 RepID=UPI001ACE7D72|nr:hypothetical protein [Sulfuritalea sp.]MBN8474461.1 hypothetical protein [Sulfuritalea sp.]